MKPLQVVMPAAVTWALFNFGGGSDAFRVWAWRIYVDGTCHALVDGAEEESDHLIPVLNWDDEHFLGYCEAGTYEQARAVARDREVTDEQRVEWAEIMSRRAHVSFDSGDGGMWWEETK